MKNLLTYLIISLSILQNLAGQATYNFKHISSQNGLSNDFVLDMAIDQQGCVWVATEAGLNKWVGNGSNIVYKESNSGLVSNELTCIMIHPRIYYGLAPDKKVSVCSTAGRNNSKISQQMKDCPAIV